MYIWSPGETEIKIVAKNLQGLIKLYDSIDPRVSLNPNQDKQKQNHTQIYHTQATENQ